MPQTIDPSDRSIGTRVVVVAAASADVVAAAVVDCPYPDYSTSKIGDSPRLGSWEMSRRRLVGMGLPRLQLS